MGQDNSVKKTLAVSSLRPTTEIHIQKEISMIWHWRCIEYLRYGNIEFKENLKDIITDIFGKDYYRNYRHHTKLQSSQRTDGRKNLFFQTAEKQCNEILRISTWRQHVFGRLFSKEDWGDIDVDS
ncbi:hypothetical protein [Helicobacter cappadocius]|uniref:Uncharacterized protein n=1 Tax=Helicobacter cappadocius TaxID=3063998 RepID=A0AA90T4P5_9HELI|nr:MULTISPECIES: hypothetical protein [unclassified Helicobacter]MDO7252700.1 hypothetical protein [Helicobacter sp. faydin-H75]MDP2538568.1 hypothetical protein [Helicobacter sp. faydin-H76]